MSREWNGLVAWLADQTPGGLLGVALTLLLTATIVAVLWYTWPPRLPFLTRGTGRSPAGGRSPRPRWRRPTWRWRFRWPRWLLGRLRWRRRRATPVALDELAPDDLPDLPAQVLALTADQLAAAGRYAEAVRERLRAIVREMIEREVIEHRPGWTVTELADAGGRARPDAAGSLRGAADVFSEIWYGLRPATMQDDVRMRGYATEVLDALRRPPVEAAR